MASQFLLAVRKNNRNTQTGYFTIKMSSQSHKSNLILASSSPYRKLLLERLGIPFEICVPSVDESALETESAAQLVSRLAETKARTIAGEYPSATVIGSDQVAVCDGAIVGKPGSAELAVGQLQEFSGRTVQFLTAVYLLNAPRRVEYRRTVVTDVCFRQLSLDEIHRYVALDKPFDCAGSFKSEAAGISLLNAMNSTDPTAIVGLPLIAVAEALRQAGFTVP